MKKRCVQTLISCMLCTCLLLCLAMPTFAAEAAPEAPAASAEQIPLQPAAESAPMQEPEQSPEPAPEEASAPLPTTPAEDIPDILPREEYPDPVPPEDDDNEDLLPEMPLAPVVTAPDTVILALPDLWGAVSLFTVYAETACIAAVSHDGGETYELLLPQPPEEEEEGFTFTVMDMTAESLLDIVPLGDANFDGLTDNDDLDAMKQLVLGRENADSLTALVLDVDRDGELTASDLFCLKAALLGKYTLNWIPPEFD